MLTGGKKGVETLPQKNDRTIGVRIPTELYDTIVQIADKQYLPISAIVKIAIAEYVQRHADQ